MAAGIYNGCPHATAALPHTLLSCPPASALPLSTAAGNPCCCLPACLSVPYIKYPASLCGASCGAHTHSHTHTPTLILSQCRSSNNKVSITSCSCFNPCTLHLTLHGTLCLLFLPHTHRERGKTFAFGAHGSGKLFCQDLCNVPRLSASPPPPLSLSLCSACAL